MNFAEIGAVFIFKRLLLLMGCSPLLFGVLAQAFFAGDAIAGVRGYRVVFIDLDAGQENNAAFQHYRQSVNLSRLSPCWASRKGDWIQIAYAKTQPIRMSPDAIKAAFAGDASSLRKFSRMLAAYTDDEIQSGFDGAYMVGTVGGFSEMVGVSVDASFAKVKIADAADLRQMDRALCDASAAFDKAFVP